MKKIKTKRTKVLLIVLGIPFIIVLGLILNNRIYYIVCKNKNVDSDILSN